MYCGRLLSETERQLSKIAFIIEQRTEKSRTTDEAQLQLHLTRSRLDGTLFSVANFSRILRLAFRLTHDLANCASCTTQQHLVVMSACIY